MQKTPINNVVMLQVREDASMDNWYVLQEFTISPTYSANTFHTKVVPVWESVKPTLTVPDLADTVEQMLARRTSGIVTPLTGPSMRIYPVDPSSVVEAGQMLKSLQELAQKEVEVTKAQIKQRRQEIAQKNAIAKQEAEEFAKYKAAKKEG